jgi:hypothetical protein
MLPLAKAAAANEGPAAIGNFSTFTRFFLNFVLAAAAVVLLGAPGAARNVIAASKKLAVAPGSFCLITSRGAVVAPSGVCGAAAAPRAADRGRQHVGDYAPKKSSKFFFKRSKLSVRGSAKNAVDHRNGGKGTGGILKFV